MQEETATWTSHYLTWNNKLVFFSSTTNLQFYHYQIVKFFFFFNFHKSMEFMNCCTAPVLFYTLIKNGLTGILSWRIVMFCWVSRPGVKIRYGKNYAKPLLLLVQTGTKLNPRNHYLYNSQHCRHTEKKLSNPCCSLQVFISYLISRETINISEIFSGVHGFMGMTVSVLSVQSVFL